MTQSQSNSANRPVHEVRVGAIKAAIWKTDSKFGPRYSTQFARLYKENGAWARTRSFGSDDLLAVGKVADLAHNWILNQLAEQAGDQPAGQEQPLDVAV